MLQWTVEGPLEVVVYSRIFSNERINSLFPIFIQTQDELCQIQSVLRRDRKVRRGEPGGNLLKAGSGEDGEKIAVDFTGTLPNDPATGI